MRPCPLLGVGGVKFVGQEGSKPFGTRFLDGFKKVLAGFVGCLAL